MIMPEKFYHHLQQLEIDFFAGVPDSLLKEFCSFLSLNHPKNRNIITANEGVAVALATGYHLSSGKIPMVYMQNSGLGNTVNPLTSLTDKEIYAIPMLLMIGWRGKPGEKDEPQHKKQGRISTQMLETLEIPYYEISSENWKAQLTTAINSAKSKSVPVAILINANTFEKYKKISVDTSLELSREEAIKIILDASDKNCIFVSTTGFTSRELYEIREQRAENHARDFLTVGSMGYASQIAVGIAINERNRQVICLDGDGAFLMQMGGLATVGELNLPNYKHLVINNGVHDSVGAQQLTKIDMLGVAKACGYNSHFTAGTKIELLYASEEFLKCTGPAMLEVKVKSGARENLGRPKIAPMDNKQAFMEHLLKK